jgi:hypothetical protein
MLNKKMSYIAKETDIYFFCQCYNLGFGWGNEEIKCKVEDCYWASYY